MNQLTKFDFSRSTVLFVNGMPVGYRIFSEQGGYRVQPDDLMAPFTQAPDIRARHCDGNWQLQPSVHSDLAAQVVEELDHLAALHTT